MLSSGERHASPKKQRRGNFYRGEAEVGELWSSSCWWAPWPTQDVTAPPAGCPRSLEEVPVPQSSCPTCTSRGCYSSGRGKDKQAELCQSPTAASALLPTPSERISWVPNQQDNCFSSHESLNLALPCQVDFFPFSCHVSFWVTRLKTRFYDQLAY